MNGSLTLFLLLLVIVGSRVAAQYQCNPLLGCNPTTSCEGRAGYCNDKILIASCNDFNNNYDQGYNGWSYGYNNGSFTEYPIYATSTFNGAWLLSDYMPSFPYWGHCGGRPIANIASVMRYNAPAAMKVRLTGSFFRDCDSCGGDGVEGRIVHNKGVMLWSKVDNSSEKAVFDLEVTLATGDTLDFEGWPLADSSCDSFAFEVNLYSACWNPHYPNIECSDSRTCYCKAPWNGPQCSDIDDIPQNDMLFNNTAVQFLVDDHSVVLESNALPYYHFGSVVDITLVSANISISDTNSALFLVRVYDSFEEEVIQPNPPAWKKYYANNSTSDCPTCFLSMLSLSLTTDLNVPAPFDKASEGRSRTVEIQWLITNTTSGADETVGPFRIYFVQVPPQREMTTAETELVQSAKIIIVGGGFAGLTAAKSVIGSIGTGQVVILEKDEILGGYDDIIVSRSVAQTTTNLIGDGHNYFEKAPELHDFVAIMKCVRTAADDIAEKRRLVRQEIKNSRIHIIENVDETWMNTTLAGLSTDQLVIDARNKSKPSSYRLSVIKLLLSAQAKVAPKYSLSAVDIYGLSFTGHMTLPTAQLLGLKLNIHIAANKTLVDSQIYSDEIAERTIKSVYDHWKKKDLLMEVKHKESRFDINDPVIKNRASSMNLLGRFDAHKLPAHNVTILTPGPTADTAILNALRGVAGEQVRPFLHKPAADTIDFMHVTEYRGSYATTDKQGNGVTQFYGIPTVGFAGSTNITRVPSLKRVWVSLLDFYPPSELAELSKFISGHAVDKIVDAKLWGFGIFVDDNKLAGISGSFFAPLIIDLVRPFLFQTKEEINFYIKNYASNRGNWQTDLIRSMLQEATKIMSDSPLPHQSHLFSSPSSIVSDSSSINCPTLPPTPTAVPESPSSAWLSGSHFVALPMLFLGFLVLFVSLALVVALK